MVWRTGKILDFWEQIDWFRKEGLPGISFHTGPCFNGQWAVFDVREEPAAARRQLKEAVAGFAESSIHGEFDIYDVSLTSPNDLVRRASVETLRSAIELAAEIGAPVVTTHEGQTRAKVPNELRRAALAQSIAELAAIGEARGVQVGMELTRDYDLALAAPASIGITLDTGHVSMQRGAGYREFGTIGGLVRHLGKKLVHIHAHDYDGKDDHIAIGAGGIDFPEIMRALKEIGFAGMLCLELSPDQTGPEGYLACRDLLQRLTGRNGTGQ
jgi:sugar phosphate isomerase/epimerase